MGRWHRRQVLGNVRRRPRVRLPEIFQPVNYSLGCLDKLRLNSALKVGHTISTADGELAPNIWWHLVDSYKCDVQPGDIPLSVTPLNDRVISAAFLA